MPSPDFRDRRTVAVEVNGTAPLDHVEIVRNNRDVHTVEGRGWRDLTIGWVDTTPFAEVAITGAPFSPEPFVFYYVRVTQADGQMAWASPVWFAAVP